MIILCLAVLVLFSSVLDPVFADCNAKNSLYIKISARNLPGRDMNGNKSDPYFRFHAWGEGYFRSGTMWDNHNPNWSEIVRIKEETDLKMLQVTFWDEDNGNIDDNLGWHDIPIARLRELKLDETYEADIQGQGRPGRIVYKRVAGVDN